MNNKEISSSEYQKSNLYWINQENPGFWRPYSIKSNDLQFYNYRCNSLLPLYILSLTMPILSKVHCHNWLSTDKMMMDFMSWETCSLEFSEDIIMKHCKNNFRKIFKKFQNPRAVTLVVIDYILCKLNFNFWVINIPVKKNVMLKI